MTSDSVSDQTAIEAALAGDWKEAIRINNQLLKAKSDSVDILNRLGYAYLKTGQIAQSKRTYQKVLELDPYNQIALKNTKLLNVVKRHDLGRKKLTLSPLQFLEDPGKTKIASCVNPAPAQIISALSPGQEVYLKARNHVVELRNEENVYLAALPDDISFRMIKLLAAGNTYQVIIKGIAKNSLIVMLRELTRGKRFAHQPSFISATATSFTPFARPESPADRPDVTATGDEEEGAEPLTEEAQT